MAKQLMLEYFIVKPVAHIVDVENSTVEQMPLGEQQFKLEDLAAFAETIWPGMWEMVNQQFADQQAAEEARQLGEAMTGGNRATKRTAKKVAARKKTAVAKKSAPAKKTASSKTHLRSVPPKR